MSDTGLSNPGIFIETLLWKFRLQKKKIRHEGLIILNQD
jgi:hypothetical protein